MFKSINPWHKETASDIVTEKLAEAEREALAHELAAEHHHALAVMYRQRAERLKRATTAAANEEVTQFPPVPAAEKPVGPANETINALNSAAKAMRKFGA